MSGVEYVLVEVTQVTRVVQRATIRVPVEEALESAAEHVPDWTHKVWDSLALEDAQIAVEAWQSNGGWPPVDWTTTSDEMIDDTWTFSEGHLARIDPAT